MTGVAPYRVVLVPVGAKPPRMLDAKRGIKTRAGAKRHAREWASDVGSGVIHVEELQTVEGGGKKYVRVASASVEGGKLKGWT